MTQNDFDFERDLSDAFAPILMPHDLQQRLLQIPQLRVQRPSSWLGRILRRHRFEWLAVAASRPTFGMTTSVAAACCSLVIGLGLGLVGLMPQSATVQSTRPMAAAATTTTSSDTDAVALLYAAADMPGDLP